MLLAIGVLSGCGGESGSTLGGVAAVGSPIVNGTVQVRCAGGSLLAASTNSKGTWQVTLSSAQTLPCAVELSYGTVDNVPNNIHYHSVASSSHTVNVTPLTDLTVANLAGMAPDAWFAGLTDTTLTTISTGSVNTALDHLRTALSGLPPLSKINPITTTFSATPGNPGDDMLAALQTVIDKYSYTALLNSAATPSFITTNVPDLYTDLLAAYADTISGGTGKAAQYFTRKEVGNTWSWLWKSEQTSTSPYTNTTTITASAGGVVTFYDTSSYGSPQTRTDQIDASGEWTSSTADSTGAINTTLVLPATFSVNTTYATSATGTQNATITAFNVTRTVPAGTFTDCLQINVVDTTTAQQFTYYLSPTAGAVVETTLLSSGATYTEQLQAGYKAN